MTDDDGDRTIEEPSGSGPDVEEVILDLHEMQDAHETAKEKKKPLLPFWVEFPLLIVIALLVAIGIKTFLFQASTSRHRRWRTPSK